MLSFAAAALDLDKKLIGTFERNLEILPNTSYHEETMAFWNKFPDELKATRVDMVDPQLAMEDFRNWLNGLKSQYNPVFCALPSRFDMKFIDYYSWTFLDESLLGISALDIESYACAVLKQDYSKTKKRTMPKKWNSKKRHKHIAINDAIEQGEFLINMIRDNLKK